MRSSAATDGTSRVGIDPQLLGEHRELARLSSGASDGDHDVAARAAIRSSGTHENRSASSGDSMRWSSGSAFSKWRRERGGQPVLAAERRATADRDRGSRARSGWCRAGRPTCTCARSACSTCSAVSSPAATSSSPSRGIRRSPDRTSASTGSRLSATRDVLAEVDVLDRVEQLDALLERPLERLAAGDQAHAAGALVDDRGRDRVAQIVLARRAAAS